MAAVIRSIFDTGERFWVVDRRLLFHAYMMNRVAYQGDRRKALVKRVAHSAGKIEEYQYNGILDQECYLIDTPSGDNPYAWVDEALSEIIGMTHRSTLSIDTVELRSRTERVSLDEFYVRAYDAKRNPPTPAQILDEQHPYPSTRRVVIENLQWLLNGKPKKFSNSPVDLIWPAWQPNDRGLGGVLTNGSWRICIYSTIRTSANRDTILRGETLAHKMDAIPVIYAPSFSEKAIRDAEELNVFLINLAAYLRLIHLLHESAPEIVDHIREEFAGLFTQVGLMYISDAWKSLL